MATAHGVSSINLLPKDSFEFSALGKALKWATTVGRVLVVLTEFVVLLAFASRFYFDKKLDDLNEVIIQKQAQIAAYAQVETDIRKVLAKQQPVDSFQTNGLHFQERIDSLSNALPIGANLETMEMTKNGIELTGKATSEYGFALFLNNVKKLKGVTNVSLNETSFDQVSGGVKFSIHITFKNG